MKANHLILTILISCLFACSRKAEPLDDIGVPVFKATGFIGNEVISIEAGRNNYYLQTAYTFDQNNVREFKGNFVQQCSSCKKSLKILLKDYKEASNVVFSADSSFSPRNYDYMLKDSANIPYYIVKFTGASTGSGSLNSQLWEFGDGTSSTNSVFSKTFKSGIVEQIKYTCNYSNSCSSTLKYNVGFKPYLNALQLPDFTITKTDSSQIIYKFGATGDDNYPYFWDFGSGKTVQGKTIYFAFVLSNVYNVRLYQVIGADTNEISKNISTGSNTDCKANFIKEIIPVKDPLNFSTISVEWTNDLGETYSSALIKQDLRSNFTVRGSLPYRTNSSGQNTRLLNVLINCKLSNGTKVIEVKNLEAKLAVAHP